MKTFQLNAEPRTDLGKKAAKNLRKSNLIPVVLNGGAVIDLPYAGTLKTGEKIVEIGNGKGLITTDLVVKTDDVRKLIYTPDIFAIELNVNGETRNAVIRTSSSTPLRTTSSTSTSSRYLTRSPSPSKCPSSSKVTPKV